MTGTCLDLSSGAPTENAIYKAGESYALWEPTDAPKKLTLNNATVEPDSSSPTSGITLVMGTASIKLVLEGRSSLAGAGNMAICPSISVGVTNVNVTIGGSGSLTLNGMHDNYGNFHVGNLITTDTTTVNSPYGTVDGNRWKLTSHQRCLQCCRSK